MAKTPKKANGRNKYAADTGPGAPKLIGPGKQALFLAELMLGKSIASACSKVDISRSCYYRTIEVDEEFNRLCKDAIEHGTDKLEDEALRRGMTGIQKPLTHQGRLTGQHITEYSDTLLITMLNARRPEKYKWRGDITSNNQSVAVAFAQAVRDANGINSSKE